MTDLDRPPPRVWATLAHVTTVRARRVLLVAGLVAGVAAISASRLRPVASIEAMLADDEPAARALRRLSQRFGGFEELIVLASAPAGRLSGEEAAPLLLAFARRLEEAIDSSPELSSMCDAVRYAPSPDVRAFVKSVMIPHALFYLGEDALAALAERLSLERMREQFRRAEELASVPGAAGGALTRAALKDPLGLRDHLAAVLPRPVVGLNVAVTPHDGFLSPDLRHLIIRLGGKRPASDLDFADAFTKAVEAAAANVNDDGLEIVCTGAYAIASAAQHAIRADMIRSIVLSILFLQILYLLVYRNFWMFPAALSPVVLGILVAFGAFAALGMSLSPITAVIGAILAGLGIDYCIHSLSQYRRARTAGLPHGEAVARMLTDIAPALIAACVTTVVGFLAISQSSVRALREFGLLGAMGLVASLVAAILVLPSILSVVAAGRRDDSFCAAGPGSKPGLGLARVVRLAADHRRLCLFLGGALLLGGACVAFAQPGRWSLFDDDLSVMHPRPNAPLDAQRRLSELFQASPDSLLIHLEAADSEALTGLAHRVASRIREIKVDEPNILGTYGLASLLPDPTGVDQRRAWLRRLDAERILADFEVALSDSAFVPTAFEAYKSFLRSLVTPGDAPGIADLQRYPALAETVLPQLGLPPTSPLAEAVTAVITARPLADRATRDAVIAAIRGAIGDLEGATLTGLTVIGHDTERTIRRDLGKLLTVAMTVVAVWLVVYFRSVGAAILALAPAIFGIVMLLAFMRLSGVQLNSVNLIALPLLVGIGVDDGIFLVSIARRGDGRDTGHAQLLDRLGAACHGVGMTSVTTVLTFGTLIFTSTPAIRSLGLFMAVGVLASFVAAVGILVPLLTAQSTRRDDKRPRSPTHTAGVLAA